MNSRRQSRQEAPPPRAGLPASAPVPPLWSAAVAAAALVGYLLLAPPVSGDKDSAEFTLVLAFGGAAHPTGYPLFTMLGHLFCVMLHAFGVKWAFAANAWSAVGGAVAVFLLQRLALALLPDAPGLTRRTRFLLTLLPVALFGANPIWTIETTLAEVYSWHVAWVGGVSLYFVWLVRGLSGLSDRRLLFHALAWGALCGVAGAHHVTGVYVAAPLSLALAGWLVHRRRMRPGLAAAVLVGALVPLSSYFYLAYRASHPAAHQWIGLEPSWASIWAHMTGVQYRRLLGRFLPSPVQKSLLAHYVYPFLFPGLLALLAGLRRRDGSGGRWIAGGLVAAAVLPTISAFRYGAADPSSYFLTGQALGTVGIVPIAGALLAGRGRARRSGTVVCAALAVSALALLVPWTRVSVERRMGYLQFDHLVRSMWESIRYDRAIVFWTDDMCLKLREYQLLDADKPGLWVENPWGMTAPPVRQRFVRRFGFDPVDGVAPIPMSLIRQVGPDSAAQDYLRRVEQNVNARTDLPVIQFDPKIRSVRLLKKPAPADTTASAVPRGR